MDSNEDSSNYEILEYVNCAEAAPNIKTVHVWTDAETKQLFKKYNLYLPEIGPMKRFKSKKEMWIQIASEIEGKTWKKCEERLKTVMRRKKRSIDRSINCKRGKRTKVESESENEKEYDSDSLIETIVPVESIESHEKEKIENDTVKRDGRQSTSEQKTVQDVLWDIANMKEKAKQRRHRERLGRMDRMCALLQRLIDARPRM